MRLLLLSALGASLLAAESKQLFNGKNLAGWKMVGPGRFVVEDGMLKTEGGMGLLYYTGAKLGNQTLRVVFKTATPKANSGVFIRLPEQPKDPWYGVHNGYEVQIENGGDEWHCTGAIYSLSKAVARPQKDGEWNTMDIELAGKRTTISVNGQKVNEFLTDQDVPERKAWYEPVRGPRPEFGYVGLQNHDARSTVYFKEISVSPGQPEGSIPQGERDRAMSYLHSTRKQFLDSTAGLTPEQWNFKAGPDRWSIAEVAEHITVSEDNLAAWAMASLDRPATAPPADLVKNEQLIAMMTDRSKKAQAPEAFRPAGRWKTREDMLRHFLSSRDRNIEFVQTTPRNLHGAIVKGPGGSMDAYQIFLMIAAHADRHLAQIAEVKASPGYPGKK